MLRQVIPIKEKIMCYLWNHKGRILRMGVGCAWLGREGEGHFKEGADILEACYKAGFRYFDTSRHYGESEQAVGQFVRRIDRKSIFLATKSPIIGNGIENFKRNFYESFERLHTDHIDLFQVHDTDSYDRSTVVLPFLQERQREGMIDYIGMGTRSLIAHTHAILSGNIQSSLSYLDYNLIKTAAKPVIELARQHDTAFINSSVLLFGLLKSENPLVSERPLTELALQRRGYVLQMQTLCKQMKVDIVAAALQYSLLNPDIDITLNGIKRLNNLESTIKCMDTVIYPEQWAELFALQKTIKTIDVMDEQNY